MERAGAILPPSILHSRLDHDICAAWQVGNFLPSLLTYLYQVGKVLSFDEESGRYLLQMSAEDQLRIKPQNLTL